MALFVMSHEPGLLADFTSDTGILAQVAVDAGLDFTDMGDDTPGRFDVRYGGRSGQIASKEMLLFDWNNKVMDSFKALGKIADNLTRMPGRKSLIWISAGFPIQLDGSVITGARGIEVSYRQDFEKLIACLNRGDIAIYAVDARGLSIGVRGFPDTLIEAAERTGGTAFYERNDLDEGVRLALEDQRAGYTLAFRVPNDARVGISRNPRTREAPRRHTALSRIVPVGGFSALGG